MVTEVDEHPPQFAAHRRIDLAMGWVRQFALVPPLILTVIVGSILDSHFLTAVNFANIAQQASELSILVLAESLILIAGKFDLSLESTFGFAPLLGAWLVTPSGADNGSGLLSNQWLGLLVVIAAGAAVGLFNGLLVVRLRLNAFIITLGMLILLRGVTVGIINGQTLTGMPPVFTYLGSATWLGASAEIWIAGILWILAAFFIRYYRTGRAIYAIGGNEEAARTAGIRIGLVVLGLYVMASVLAAFSGLMAVGRFGGITSTQGQNMIFTVFAAAVIGGISLKGGKGSIIGALLGVLLLGTVSDLLLLKQVSQYWIDASYGAIIIAALCVAKLTGAEQD